MGLTGSILHGYAVTDHAVIIDTDGLKSFEQKNPLSPPPEEGRFCGIFNYNDKVIIKCDLHGQDIIYLFRDGGGGWAISNSFLMLAIYASKHSDINFYQPASLSFLLKNGAHVGEQLISHRTMIDEIEILPLNQEIHVNKSSGELSIVSKSFTNIFETNNVNYDDTIISMLSKGMSILESIARTGQDIYLSLSGGYDSRLVLGMLSRKLIDTKRIFIKSDVNRRDDFAIAQKLCDILGFKLNDYSPPRRECSLSATESYRAFLLSCCGTYLPIYPIRSHALNSSSILRLTGDYAVDASFFKGSAIFNGNMKKVGKDISVYLEGRTGAEQAIRDFNKVFDVLGVDICDPISSAAYYCAIRSRHHCGRQWYKTMGNDYLMTPLMSKDFTRLNLLNYSGGRREDELFTDLYCAMGNWATDTPFHSAKGSLNESLVKQSKFRGGISIDHVKYDVYGSFNKNKNNNSISILDIPTGFGFDDDDFEAVIRNEFLRIEAESHHDIFNPDNINRIQEELDNRGRLSHTYRGTTHMLYVDLIKKITYNK